MVRATTKVYVRTRPADQLADGVTFAQDGKTIVVNPPRKAAKQTTGNSHASQSFSFDGVLHNSPQEEVYDTAVHDFVASGLTGVNGTLLAYGQTGAGKTYTMIGGSAYATRGVIPRALAQIFNHQKDRPDLALEVHVSFLEIYNEQLVDLLVETPSPEALVIFDDATGAVAVRGLTRRACMSESDALAALFEGLPRRHTSTHAMNAASSRSHVIFTVQLYTRSRVESHGRAVTSKLHFVDLAGSERVGRSGVDKSLLNETRHINQTLTYLEQVVVALGNPSRDHVPFRSSRLTSMLRDSLGGNARSVLIAGIWPDAQYVEESASTLRFAARMARVECEYVVNVSVDPELQVRALQRQVAELRAELALYQNRGARVGPSTPSPAEVADAMATAQAYVTGSSPDIEFNTMRYAVAVCRCLRELCLQARAQADAAAAARPAGAAAADAAASGIASSAAAAKAAAGAGAGGAVGVGTLQAAGGFSVGQATAAARNIPAVAAPQSLSPRTTSAPNSAANGQMGASGSGRPNSRGTKGFPPGTLPAVSSSFVTTRGAAASGGGAAAPPPGGSVHDGGSGGGPVEATYDEWSRGPGRVATEQLRSTQRLLEHAVGREKVSAEAVEQAKATVATAKARLDEVSLSVELMVASTGAADAVALAERDAVGKALTSTQHTYQLNRDALAAAANERSQLQQALQELKREAASEFGAWRSSLYAAANGAAAEAAASGAEPTARQGQLEALRAAGGDSHAMAYYMAIKLSSSPFPDESCCV